VLTFALFEQLLQVLVALPVPLFVVPFPHAVHALLVALVEYEPFAQALQESLPPVLLLLGWNLPAPHAVHAPLPK
jgi:hypothetical protein